ncbi:unannotated protein [freshwater metagenome]|uniref:Unannotated protein n=1 Tax=freshwater metagenome TaxID=449393 RepID=A0A6J5ZPS0_9ZZZZ
MLAKWRLIAMALPFALGVLVLRYFVHSVLNVEGALSFGDSGAVITGAAIIMGLMLNGVIGDYREAEKLPAAVGGNLVAFENFARRGFEVIDKDNTWVHDRLKPLAHAINEWILGRTDTGTMWAAYEDNSQLIVDAAKAGVTIPYLNQLHASNNSLGGALDRIDGIRKTSFIRAGYALLEFLVAVVLGAMVVCDFSPGIAAWLIPSAIAMVYSFMVLFIRDLDNPFGYGDNSGKGSAADVDLDAWTAIYNLYK